MTTTLTALLWLFASPVHASSWRPPHRLASDYSDALVALGKGELEKAEAGFAALVAAEPNCGMCVHGLAVSALRRGALSQAILLLEDGARRWPGQSEIWVSLSASAFAAQDFPLARSAAEEAVRVDPGSLDGQAALQQALLRTGALEDAAAALQTARAALPDPVVACFEVQLTQERRQTPDPVRLAACRQAGTPDLVAGVLSRSGDAVQLGALAARLGLDPVVLVAQAMDQHSDGESDAAIALLDEVLAGWPHRADARAMRAQLRADTGDREGALADLHALLGARSWVDIHRTGAMSGILRQSDAQRLASTIAEAAALQIDLHLDAQDLRAAAVAWSQAEGLPPHPAPLAAGARLAVAQGDPASAWSLVLTGIQTFPGDPRPIAVAGAVALADPEGLPAAAEAALQRSMDWRDGHNLALAYRKRGSPTDCLTRTRTTDAASGLSGEARRRLRALGYACAVEAADWAAAAAAFRRLSDASLASPIARYNHALALYQGNNPAGSRAVLGALPSQTETLDPGVSGAVLALALRVAVAEERWTDASEVLSQEAISQEDRVWGAERLLQAGRASEARRALSDCSALEPELQRRCAAVR